MIRLLTALVAVAALGGAWWRFTDRVLASEAAPAQDQPAAASSHNRVKGPKRTRRKS